MLQQGWVFGRSKGELRVRFGHTHATLNHLRVVIHDALKLPYDSFKAQNQLTINHVIVVFET